MLELFKVLPQISYYHVSPLPSVLHYLDLQVFQVFPSVLHWFLDCLHHIGNNTVLHQTMMMLLVSAGQDLNLNLFSFVLLLLYFLDLLIFLLYMVVVRIVLLVKHVIYLTAVFSQLLFQ